MNNRQFLLLKLAEEANEVAIRAHKMAQFGMDEIQPDQPLTNVARLNAEINDFQAAVEMLNEEEATALFINHSAVEAKKQKTRKFREYSIKLGMVQPTNHEGNRS